MVERNVFTKIAYGALKASYGTLKLVVSGIVKIFFSSEEKDISKGLGIKVDSIDIRGEDGDLKRLEVVRVPRIFIHDLRNLSEEQLNRVRLLGRDNGQNCRVHLDQGNEKVMFTVDVEEICKKVSSSGSQTRKLVVEEIAKELNMSIKKLASAVGGEFKTYEDQRILRRIAENLYDRYEKREKCKEATHDNKSTEQNSETLAGEQRNCEILNMCDGNSETLHHNMSHPPTMLHNSPVAPRAVSQGGGEMVNSLAAGLQNMQGEQQDHNLSGFHPSSTPSGVNSNKPKDMGR